MSDRPGPTPRRALSWSVLTASVTASLLALSGCATVTAERLTSADVQQLLSADRKLAEHLAAPPVTGPITVADAMARALAYNLDIRQSDLDVQVAGLQNGIAQQFALPRAMATSDYKWRSNDGSTSTSPDSVPRSSTTGGVGVTWNLLELGLGYLGAKRAANDQLAAEVKRVRAANMVLSEALQVYWRAADASDHLPEVRAMAGEIASALARAKSLSDSMLQDPVLTLSYSEALLDLQRQLAGFENEIDVARVQLARLIRLPDDAAIELRPAGLETAMLQFDFSERVALERTALYARTELRELGYLQRNSQLGWYQTFVGLLPSLTLGLGAQHDNNSQLVNNWWRQNTLGFGFDLLNLYRMPQRLELAEKVIGVSELRRVTASIMIVEQVRLSLQQVELAQKDYGLAQRIAATRREIFRIRSLREPLSVTDELESIRAGISSLAGALQEDRARANLRMAYGQALFSLGVNFIPENFDGQDAAIQARLFQAHIDDLPKQLRRLIAESGELAAPAL